MTKEGHGACLFALSIITIGNIALAIENNESRIISIPKKEFLSVLRGIINSSNESARDAENYTDTNNINKGDEFTGKLTSKMMKSMANKRVRAVIQSPRGPWTKKSQNSKDSSRYISEYDEVEEDLFEGKNVKKDSFYYLQRNMELRKASNIINGLEIK